MNCLRPWLYIGRYRETLDRALLAQLGVQAMLHLAEPVHHAGIETLYLPVEDGVPLEGVVFQQGLRFIHASYHQQRTLLIACGAGVSRSATFAIAGIKEIEDLPLLDAYRAVKARHPDAMPHPALWQSLCDHYHEEIPFFSLFHLTIKEPE
jgi:hypothetical protein